MNGRSCERMGRVKGWSVAAFVLFPLGCGGDLTSGGFGEVEILVSSEATAEATSGAARAALSPPAAATSDDPIDGTLSVHVRVWIREAGGQWVEVTDGAREVTMPLSEPTPVLLATGDVRAGSYDAVRTTFGRVRAQVVRGLTVDGDTIVGEIPVELGPDGTLTIEAPIDLHVEQARTFPLVLEMNASVWLRLVDRVERTVREADFRGAFGVRVQPGR